MIDNGDLFLRSEIIETISTCIAEHLMYSVSIPTLFRAERPSQTVLIMYGPGGRISKVINEAIRNCPPNSLL